MFRGQRWVWQKNQFSYKPLFISQLLNLIFSLPSLTLINPAVNFFLGSSLLSFCPFLFYKKTKQITRLDHKFANALLCNFAKTIKQN